MNAHHKVFVGSQDSRHNAAGLKERGIRAVLDVAFGDIVGQSVDKNEDLEEVLRLPLLDEPSQPLQQTLETALAFLDRCEQRGVPVLVHCNAGISRSVSVCVAFLMRKYSIGYDEALATIRVTRPSAKPNAGFEAQLRKWKK